MDLSLSDEQRLLQDSVARFFGREYAFDKRRAILELPERFSPAIWRTMAELGWLGLPLPEAEGGSGGGAVEDALVMEQLGKGLVLEPYATTVLLCGGLLAAAGSPEQCGAWLPRIAAGEVRMALAYAEPGVAHEAGPEKTTALRTDQRWRLDGAKRWVVDAPGADQFIVSARNETSGQDQGAAALLFLVPRDAPGLRLAPFEMVDGRLAAHLAFDSVELPDSARLAGSQGDMREAIDLALDRLTAATCAEAVGCMQVLLAQTVAYANTRVQFGQPIAMNQALRHRMVDMSVQCEEARAIALRATLYLSRPADERARAVAGAKIKVARAARVVSEGAIQIHGAMGVTEELNVGAYVKRLLAFEMSFGTPADCQRRLVALRARAGGPRAFA